MAHNNDKLVEMLNLTQKLTELNRELAYKVKQGIALSGLRELYTEIKDIHKKLNILHEEMKH